MTRAGDSLRQPTPLSYNGSESGDPFRGAVFRGGGMSLKVKLAAAFAVSIVLLGGLLYLVFRTEAPEEAPPAAGPEPVVEVPAPKAIDRPAKPIVEKKEAPAPKRESERPAASSAVVGAGPGWTMIGRIVREERPGEAAGPVAGAAVHLKPHPRLARPETAPAPARV